MSGVVNISRRRDIECERRGPRRWKTARVGGGLLLLSAVIALAAFAFSAETKAQSAKTLAPDKGPAAKTRVDPKDLYGDQGGEKVEAANARLPNTVMRARLEDTFLKLSNPRVEQTPQKLNVLRVDYEVVNRGKLDGGLLVLRTEDGARSEVELKSIIGRDNGTVDLVGVKFFGNLKLTKNTTFPENIEFYMVRTDDRYDPPLKCMVSASVVMGKIKGITRARDWTPEEIERYHVKPPLAYKTPNTHPDVGEDVPPLPEPTGANDFRYVDPDGMLLGLDYHVAGWDMRTAVWRLAPVYSLDQPKKHSARSVARKGYAVAGAEVNVDKYVCGIRLLFRRVKPDGTLDAKDGYSGDWIGTPPKGEATKLVNDGRRVLGVHFKYGAIVDRFSLVVDGEKK